MRRIPIDTEAFMAGVVQAVGFTPIVDFETGEQRRTKTGQAQWRLSVVYSAPPTPERPQPGEPELVKIKFVSNELPEHIPGGQLVLHGLAVSHWEITENGRITKSGATISADGIGFTPPANGNGNGARRSEPAAA